MPGDPTGCVSALTAGCASAATAGCAAGASAGAVELAWLLVAAGAGADDAALAGELSVWADDASFDGWERRHPADTKVNAIAAAISVLRIPDVTGNPMLEQPRDLAFITGGAALPGEIRLLGTMATGFRWDDSN